MLKGEREETEARPRKETCILICFHLTEMFVTYSINGQGLRMGQQVTE